MATEYRYLFADLLTNQIIAELPLTNVQFEQELNTSGSFSGNLLLSDARLNTSIIDTATQPGRTALYVDRNGVLVWGGIIWTRTYNSSQQTIYFTGAEFESYFQKRRIISDQIFSNVDQLVVAQTIINHVQAQTNGNIGVIVGSETSGVLVSKTIYSYELKPCLEFIYELSRSSTGFDFNIDVTYGLYNVPYKYLRLDYPRRGTVYSSSNPSALMLELPGNIVAYDYPEDGSRMANTMYGIGSGQGASALIIGLQDATAIANGWARLDSSVSYTDYADTTVLTNLTQGQLDAYKYPLTTITVTIPAYVDPVLGSYKTGDDVRLRITDARFPTTIDIVRRISKISVNPGEDGPEQVTLTLVQTTN